MFARPLQVLQGFSHLAGMSVLVRALILGIIAKWPLLSLRQFPSQLPRGVHNSKGISLAAGREVQFRQPVSSLISSAFQEQAGEVGGPSSAKAASLSGVRVITGRLRWL